MLESKVEKDICKFAKDHGISVLKLNGLGEKGKADRMFMRKGVVAFLEIKKWGEHPTALQSRWLNQRVKDGFAADWCSTVADGMNFLREAFDL